MELKSLLFWIGGLSAAGFAGALLLAAVLAGRLEREHGANAASARDLSDKLRWKSIVHVFLQRSYQQFLKIPFLRSYTLRIRSRLTVGMEWEEYPLRLRTAGTVYGLLLLFITVISLLYSLNPDVVYLLTLLISSAVIHGLLLDAYVNRIQRKLLRQTIDLFSGVRHAYQRHGIVDEAIQEASEEAEREISVHGYCIYEALNAPDPEKCLESYYERSPGRFLRTFAGVSFLIMEYGDKDGRGGSLYLRALAELGKEIHLEILRLSKLDYVLKGLNVIALAPLFFTKPIERWARGNFPLMDVFYAGKYGMLTKMFIYLIILVCYILLQKIKSEDEVKPVKASRSWEMKLYERSWVRRLVQPLLPSVRSQTYARNAELLRDTFSKMRVEWFYVRRLVYALAAFGVALSVFLFLHANQRYHLLNLPAAAQVVFGSPDKEERLKLAEEAALDKEIMKELGMSKNAGYEEIADRLSKREDAPKSREELNTAVSRIAGKLSSWNSEVLQVWEIILAVGAAAGAYYGPYWLLMFQRRIRRMDMQHEIYQFYTLILILREMERMSVEEILEWLNSFAVIFKAPIEKCLLHYEHGQEAALEGMKQDAAFPEFERLTDKLLLAAGRITVKQAFDDVDHEMGFYFEQRKLDYEKTLDLKANMGKMIGFTPMYALIFMYLVLPLIWMSFSQMSVYYEQIQKL
ncbi:hypothetical protein [Paenibacillus pinistramenti]|uniref:hypothetical protein n=1 Tax=Paenibacillus pinistramenti TaxID=1768003 RepID=UPI001107FB21|nr:hypothetical protein [Paenibacillus pinistramenti]